MDDRKWRERYKRFVELLRTWGILYINNKPESFDEYDAKRCCEQYRQFLTTEMYNYNSLIDQGYKNGDLTRNDLRFLRGLEEFDRDTYYNVAPEQTLGLMSHRIWIERRIIDIIDAMIRYIDSDLVIPIEWIDEYNKLVKWLNND